MHTFLHSVARRIFDNHPGGLHNIIVVFNNRRAGLFLQQQFKELSDKPFFLPRVIGIDDLVLQLGGLQIEPHEFLLFELYDIHRNLEGVEQRFESFEEFMPFGEMLLSDFSDIDLYRVDASRLFENLHDLKRLGEWDISGQPLSPFQEKYLNFFRSLNSYYQGFRRKLADKGQAYSGMAYRHVADNIGRLAEKIDCDHIYFVGFNALSDCEATIMECLARQGKASLIFDGDDYYVSDELQEAGLFIRKNATRFLGIGDFGKYFAQSPKTIHVVNCPENTLQAKAMGNILSSMLPNGTDSGAHDCAIVLADEQLLLPVLNSLPPQVGSTNITMGFPFVYSAIHTLNNKLLSLYNNIRDGLFYHRDIMAVLSDDIIAQHLGATELQATVRKRLLENKCIFASKDEIVHWISDVKGSESILFLFDNSSPSPADILTILIDVATLAVNSPNLTLNTAGMESLACSIQVIKYLQELEDEHHCLNSVNTLQRIYIRIAQRRNIAFYGEPLHGIQVLGMLETRSLDFRHLIILSVNEGILPAGRGDNTLIPLSLKKAFGLPTYEEKDAVYAYNFYRLLQRSDEVWLLYSSFAEGIGKGEPSRFIMQLRDEMAARLHNITIVDHVVQAINAPVISTNIEIDQQPKDQRALQRLNEMGRRGLSPSALNRYRSCPKQFFFTDILGVNEQDEIEEQLQANELGSFIHSILCDIFNRDKDKIIRVKTLSESLEELDETINRRYRDDILQGRDAEGKNHIYGEVAKMQIRHFIENEITLLKQGHSIQMLLTEEELCIPLTQTGDGTTQTALIHGITDRVDRIDGTLRIADYKSGSVESDELRVDEASPSPHDVPDKWFQLMTYAWLYCRKYNYHGTFQSGIFPLRTLGAGFMPASWEGVTLLDNSHIERFETMLVDLLSQLFDPTEPFRATPSKQSCKYCPISHSCPSAILPTH